MPAWVVPVLAGLVLTVWFFYLTRHGGEADGKGVYNRLQRGWRRLAFWAGDICVLRHFPWITWDKHGCRVSEEEWMDAMAELRSGDIVLTTHERYPLSNLAIPGCFKHAGLIVEGPMLAGGLPDIRSARVVEAVSEGVQDWSPMRMRADRMIVLRPKDMTEDDVRRAKTRAVRIVGCNYDASFKFNMEQELAWLGCAPDAVFKARELAREGVTTDAIKEFAIAVHNIEAAHFDMAFSCTEVVALAWWHKREELRLFRRRSRGRNVIVADQLVNNGSVVVWTNVASAEGERFGLHEEGVELLKHYWATKGVAKCAN
jgi:hypothetical protein